MEDFDAQQIKIGPAKHLALHMSLRDAITFGPGASCVHGGIVSVNAIGKPGKFGDTTGFYTQKPLIQGVGLTLFEQGHSRPGSSDKRVIWSDDA